jgi:alpha,alpha-trehalose-phosphate synthase [UDP-forming]
VETPLLVATNRLPFTLVREARGLERRPSTGGVVSSLDALLRHRGGAWLGWPGLMLRHGETIPHDLADTYRVESFGLSEAEIAHYYDGFCNRTLWPLFHDFVERARFAADDWCAYREVNERVALEAASRTNRDVPVFVNDYHLMLVPASLRARQSDRRVTFFLHIPFPPLDVLRLCPWHQELVKGLLGCDLVAFQTGRHVEHFLAAAETLAEVEVDRTARTVRSAGRVTRVGAFPIGADFERFDHWAREAPRRSWSSRVVIGVDRLDYTKGLCERLRAFERLLDEYPEHRGHTTLVQLAAPSRPHLPEYQDLKREFEAVVNSVNSRFGTPGWMPVHYQYELLPQPRLAEFFRAADVALVTPLSDGMNLVAKEYVASQVDERGVLVLSTTAGAAETMTEALTTDPRDIDATAEALHRALTMHEAERQARMRAMRDRERRNHLHAWAQRLLDGSLS